MSGGGDREEGIREQLAWSAVERINGAWLAGEWDALERALDEEVVMALPGFAGRVVGRAAVLQSFREFRGACETHEFLVPSREVDIAGRTAVVAFTFTMTYVRCSRAFKCTGRDVWVMEERTGQVWKAVWRTMLDTREWPLVTVAAPQSGEEDTVLSVVRSLSNSLLPPVDPDSKLAASMFADAVEEAPSPPPADVAALHFPGVAPPANKSERASLAVPIACDSLLIAQTEAEGRVGVIGWVFGSEGKESDVAVATCRVNLFAFPQDDGYVAAELMLDVAERAAAHGCSRVTVSVHPLLEEADEVLFPLGFRVAEDPDIGYREFSLPLTPQPREDDHPQ